MSENDFQKVIEVGGEVIDRNGHVNNVVYVEWMQELALEHSATWREVEDFMERQGTSWFARKHVIEYLMPVFEGDVVVGRTWIESVGRVKCLRRYEFLRDGRKVAQGETEWVYVDAKSGRPRRIPEEMRAGVL